MNPLARLAATLSAFCFASSALAATPPTNHYMSISYFQNSTEFVTDAGTILSDVDNLNLRYGYRLFSILAVEGIFSFSGEKVDEDDETSVQNDYLYSVLARGNWNLPAYNVSLYGMLGASHAKNTYTTDGSALTSTVSYSTTASGLSYGVGVELFGAPSTALHVEWIRYLNTDDLVAEGWVFGLTHYFAMPGRR